VAFLPVLVRGFSTTGAPFQINRLAWVRFRLPGQLFDWNSGELGESGHVAVRHVQHMTGGHPVVDRLARDAQLARHGADAASHFNRGLDQINSPPPTRHGQST
jgi:hypothetical protein